MLARRLSAIALLWCLSAAACAVTLENTRIWRAPDRVRIVFDMDAAPFYQVNVLRNPDRVTLDVPGGELRGAVPGPSPNAPLLRRIRVGKSRDKVQRLVFDVAYPVKPRAEILPPIAGHDYRLILTLPREPRPPTKPANVKPLKPAEPAVPAAPPPAPRDGRNIVVAVDAGHGGEDPGAIGRNGLYEKDAVLAIARELARRINAAPGMRAVLTRDGDYYVKLRQRVLLARKHDADLFISVHADAAQRRSARGSSVYALSLKGASSESARRLAQRENISDFAGGISLRGKDRDVAQTIVELSMDSTIKNSIALGRGVLGELKKLGPLHSERVEQAGFAVLKSVEVRSILVETAYISNPQEEKLLRSRKHQKRLAATILRGIQKFCSQSPSACRK